MRVLIVHNQLWAHYKSRLFSEIHLAMQERYPESELLVLQIALYEASRSVMQSDDTIVYDYPYQVLFPTSLDQTNWKDRRSALFAAFDAFRPTVLNITGYADPAQVLLMFYARSKDVKVIISSESSSLDQQRSGLKELFKKLIINRANAFFCFGETSAAYMESLGARPGEILVRNAAVIDEDVIRKQYDLAEQQSVQHGNARQFIYVGRLAKEKNLETLIHAFANVQKRSAGSEPWQLLFVGDGPERALLEKLAAKQGLANAITFAGGHPWYKVPAFLAQSDVLILPSQSEPWGLVVNEAMVCGMPVIVSDKCGCVADLVKNDQNGFTFDPNQQAELEKAMQFFIQNPEKMTAMGKASLRIIAPFSSKKVARQMADCFHHITA